MIVFFKGAFGYAYLDHWKNREGNSNAEETLLSAIRSGTDAEITAPGHHRDKTRQIKQGIMQQLFTDRIRLVKPEETI